jgi:5-methylthioadenosine/S-adenosylhomocysteine deaminase
LASGAGNLYEVLRFLEYPQTRVPLTLGIGTDGAASSNTLSPLEQARYFALLGKDRWADATAFDLGTVWRTLMAGHEALHQNTGDVAEGYAADLAIWDLRQAPTWPLVEGEDPGAVLAAILYSADNRSVRDVMVAGRFLKRSGRVVALDTQEVMERAAAARTRLLALGAGKAKVRY